MEMVPIEGVVEGSEDGLLADDDDAVDVEGEGEAKDE